MRDLLLQILAVAIFALALFGSIALGLVVMSGRPI